MYLISFGTRPELIKLIPLINKFKELNFTFKTLFTGQHENLIKEFYKYIDKPDFIFDNIMEHGQTLNELSSKILLSSNKLFKETPSCFLSLNNSSRVGIYLFFNLKFSFFYHPTYKIFLEFHIFDLFVKCLHQA